MNKLVTRLKRHLSLWKVLLLSGIIEVYIFFFNPDILGYTNQDNLTWMLLGANYTLFILINGWETIYLHSPTVCPAGMDIPLITAGDIHINGLWMYIFGGISPLDAGYNTHTPASLGAGLKRQGKNIIVAPGTHCYQVGGIEGGVPIHLMITGQTEEQNVEYTPFEIKPNRDAREPKPKILYMSTFTSRELSIYRNHIVHSKGADGSDRSKTIDITSLVADSLQLDMEYDVRRKIMLNDPAPILVSEEFRKKLNIKTPGSSTFKDLFRQDTRDEDGDV